MFQSVLNPYGINKLGLFFARRVEVLIDRFPTRQRPLPQRGKMFIELPLTKN